MQEHLMLWFLDNSEGMPITKQHNLCVCWGGNFQKIWLCNLLKNDKICDQQPCQMASGFCVLLWLQQCCRCLPQAGHFPGPKYTCYAPTLSVQCLGKYPRCLMLSFSSSEALVDIVFLSWRIKWRPAPTVHTLCKIHQQEYLAFFFFWRYAMECMAAEGSGSHHYLGVQTRDLTILSTKTMTNYCIQLEPL